MPDVEALSEPEAARILDDLEVDVRIFVRHEISDEETGTILSQIPEAGTEIEEGQVVWLMIAEPPPTQESVADLVADEVDVELVKLLARAPAVDWDIVPVKPDYGRSLVFGFKGPGANSGKIYDAIKRAVLSNKTELDEVGLRHVGFMPSLGTPIVFLAEVDRWRFARTSRPVETWLEIGTAHPDLF